MPALPTQFQRRDPSCPGERTWYPAPRGTINSMLQSPVIPVTGSQLPAPFRPSSAPFDATPLAAALVNPELGQLDEVEAASERRSYSTPGLAVRLASRISTAFDPPTVIYRPTSKFRNGIRSILFEGNAPPGPSAPAAQQANDANASGADRSHSSLSSGNNRGGVLPTLETTSTAPTSDTSSILASDAKERLAISPANAADTAKPESAVSRENASRSVTGTSGQPRPTIVTVEAAATAKIYFETYFDRLLNRESARQQRQNELERRLAALPMTHEERAHARQSWRQQETEQLRLDRVLRSKADFSRTGEGMSVAGFQVLKVLGKGSFGIVRLVREKMSENEAEAAQGGTSVKAPANHPRPRTASAMGALRAAVDAGRSPRRKDWTKQQRDVYAMKVIRKTDMIRNCQEGHLRAERDFLVAAAGSRWVVSLLASFQDQHFLYLVMDYMVGGDFLGLLIRKNILSEDVTRFYVAEMILCVEEAHRLRWIHRDIKPDNFLISASGHLKISDFGLAFDGHWSHTQTYYTNHRQTLLEKLGVQVEGDLDDKRACEKAELERSDGRDFKRDRSPAMVQGVSGKGAERGCRDERDNKARTPSPPQGESILRWRNREEKRKLAKSVVGTSQYMAPEVIRGELYDGRCDWWSIGIILYECLYGFTPFTAENRHDTKLKILKHTQTLRFPVESSSERLVSAEAIDLIEQILQEKEYRLCSKKYLLNDFAHSGRVPGELINCPADKTSKHYRGYFVYPDDAEDIKAHPFFRGLRWHELHLRRPPFVPRIKSWEDTKYFDDDEPISDIADSTLTDGGECQGQGPGPAQPCPLEHHVTTCRHPCVVAGGPPPDDDKADKKGKKKRERKRPRDIILRDDRVAAAALRARARGAFLGYAYRRPKDIFARLETDRGRALIASRDYS
ncbi:hypothetical protein KEM52_001094 [Ascosphaera acerosa]|nr:hypothetical protein KEM52_001094 [Ascosphaera acerosa]